MLTIWCSEAPSSLELYAPSHKNVFFLCELKVQLDEQTHGLVSGGIEKNVEEKLAKQESHYDGWG